MKTKVAIIGGGPSGLLLSQILHNEGIDNVVLERHSREHVEGRIRAGVLEQITVDLLERAGVATRMRREGLRHDGFSIAVDGEQFRIDMRELTHGASVMVYGQTELTKDLIEANIARHGALEWQAEQVMLHDLAGDQPRVTYVKHGKQHEIQCDFVAGCDGYHGVCRTCILPK